MTVNIPFKLNKITSFGFSFKRELKKIALENCAACGEFHNNDYFVLLLLPIHDSLLGNQLWSLSLIRLHTEYEKKNGGERRNGSYFLRKKIRVCKRLDEVIKCISSANMMYNTAISHCTLHLLMIITKMLKLQLLWENKWLQYSDKRTAQVLIERAFSKHTHTHTQQNKTLKQRLTHLSIKRKCFRKQLQKTVSFKTY